MQKMVIKFSSRFIRIILAMGCTASLLWTSCTKENKDSGIILNKSSVNIMAGAKDTILIVSENSDCVVTTDNQKVAFAEIKENKIIISTFEMGVATLTVTDKLKRTSEINVSAQGPRIGGWREYFPAGVEFVFVNADNELIKGQIKSQLIEEAQLREGAVYSFGNTEFSYQPRNISVVQGSFTVKNLVLTIKYDSREESYEILSAGNSMLLKQNLTTYFINQYPDAGITRVEEFRRLNYFTF